MITRTILRMASVFLSRLGFCPVLLVKRMVMLIVSIRI